MAQLDSMVLTYTTTCILNHIARGQDGSGQISQRTDAPIQIGDGRGACKSNQQHMS